ncbi:MAG: hypothetical protein ACYC27_18390 [Armatimonadota bacterium]
MPAEDSFTTRLVQREISRRYIDTTRLDVKSYRGIVYLRGVIKKLRGHDLDLNKELEIIDRILRSRPEVRDVIMDVKTVN